MLKKFILSVFFCMCIFPGFSQTVPDIDPQEPTFPAEQEIEDITQLDTLLEQAYQTAQTTANEISNPTGTKPWQLAMFVAAHPRPLPVTFDKIKHQIRNGYISIATVLYIHPQKNSSSQEIPPASQATLYLFYTRGETIHQESHAINLSQSPLILWEVLLKHLNRQSLFYTGILIEAHSHDTGFFYGDRWFDTDHLTKAVVKQHLTVDFMELHSCHASSLFNLYRLARNAKINYLVISSALSTSSDNFIYFLPFLNQVPAAVAVNSTRQRLKDIPSSLSFTTNAAALNLKALKRPLLEYVRVYQELLDYQESSLYESKFDSFFNREIESLSRIVKQQRDFVRTRLNPKFPALYQTQHQFIAACDNLLQALKWATMEQWCYSKQDNTVYHSDIPAYSDCLESVNVSKYQYQQLWD